MQAEGLTMAARSGRGKRDGAPILFRRGAALLALVVLGSVLAAGCSTPGSSRSQISPEGIRPASGDSARYLRNAYYFNLMGRPDLALKELEEAYQQDPQNLKVVQALARNYEELGEFERAQKLYQEALSRHGSLPALENNLCFSYYQAGRFEEAEACFRRALARNPQNSLARNNLGLLYCRIGKLEEARRLWREAEGERVAQERMSQALAALGIKEPGPLAQSPQPAPTPTKKILTQTKIAQAPVSGATPGAVSVPGSPPPENKLKTAAVTPQPAPQPQAVKPAPAAVTAKVEPPVAAAGGGVTPASVPVQGPSPSENQLKTATVAPQPAPQPQPVIPGPAAGTVKGESPAVTASPTQPPRDSLATTSAQVVKPPLTLEELLGNAIEVRNGNGLPEIAHEARTMLGQEGFQVARIGNHIDFGMEQTTIFYRPGAERVARALSAKFFPTSKLEPSQKLPEDVNLKIILGRDLLEQPLKTAAVAPQPAPPPQAIKPGPAAGTAKGEPPVAAAGGGATPASVPVQGSPPPENKLKTAAVAPQPAPQPQAVKPGPAAGTAKGEPPAAAASTQPRAESLATTSARAVKPPLTLEELLGNAIEVRNGNGSSEIAHEARTMLGQEGFQVARIGNHIDFGMEQTTIFYRPGAERVARALSAKFFPTSRLEPSQKLPEDVNLKIILGRDLLKQPQLLEKLAAEGDN